MIPVLFDSYVTLAVCIFLAIAMSHDKWNWLFYRLKLYYIYLVVFFAQFGALPVSLLLPGHNHNIMTIVNLVGIYCRILGAKFHLQGAIEKVPKLGGGVVVINHQHALDIVGGCTFLPIILKVTLMAKSSLKYYFAPAWLIGLKFVDRTAGAEAHKEVTQCVVEAKADNIKIVIYPEGTRNQYAIKTKCFLPFKKGPFRAAIHAQVPIIPIVIAPYYFCNEDANYFEGGDVIAEVLDPILTEGLTDRDTEAVLVKCRKLMLDKFLLLREQTLAKLPVHHPVFHFLKDNGTESTQL